jgi:hypothetical protein
MVRKKKEIDQGIIKAQVSKKSAPIEVGSYIRMYRNGKVHSWKPRRRAKTDQ